jgi:hypothetical protein
MGHTWTKAPYLKNENFHATVIFYSAQQYEVIAFVKNSSLTLHLLPAAKIK